MLRNLLAAVLLASGVGCSSTPRTTADDYKGPPPVVSGGMVYPPRKAPRAVHLAAAAANSIQHVPYQYGGGHGRPSQGLDCSGAVSYVLRSAGLLKGSMPSSGFRRYGRRGPGKWITVYARDGHAFLTICGVRLDTGGRDRDSPGPRWHFRPRRTEEFTIRHPRGL